MGVPWRAALGLALGAAGMYWAFRGVSWSEFTGALRDSNIPLWICAVAVSQTIYPLRAARWRPILFALAPDVRFGSLWRATAIGMMVNNVIPARVGELARAYALAREEPRVSFSSGLASLVVDRAFDALILLLLVLVAVLDPRFGASTSVGAGTVGALVAGASVAVIGGFAVLYLGVFSPAQVEAFAGATVRRFAPLREARAREIARGVTAGLGVLRDARRFVAVFLWTTAHWLACGLSVWLSFKALGIQVPMTAALLTQGLIAFGAAAPQAPGYFGVFEAAGAAALGVYGVDKAPAIAWALSYHVLTIIPITVIGTWYFVKLGVKLDELRGARRTATP